MTCRLLLRCLLNNAAAGLMPAILPAIPSSLLPLVLVRTPGAPLLCWWLPARPMICCRFCGNVLNEQPSAPPSQTAALQPSSPGVDLDALAAAGAARIQQRGAAVREPPQQQRGLKQRNGLFAILDAVSGLFSMFKK